MIGNAAQGGLVQDHIFSGAGPDAGGQVPDVPFDEGEVGPLGRGDQGLDLVQVALVAGGEIVQTGHVMVLFEQGFATRLEPMKPAAPVISRFMGVWVLGVGLFFLYAVFDAFDVAAAQAFDLAAQFKVVLDFGIAQDAEAVDDCHGSSASR